MPTKGKFKHLFRHSWRDVFLASWKKYPCPSRPDILSIDIVNKNFDPERQVLTTTRLVTLKSTAPSWLQPVLGGSLCWFVEEAVIDIKNQKMVLYSKNINFKSLFSLEESCTYVPSSENPDWTQLKQIARASAHVFGIAGAMEDFAFSKFDKNQIVGREIMENAIRIVETEGKKISEAVELAQENIEKFTQENFELLAQKNIAMVGM